MPYTPDLTGFTLMLIIVTACIIPEIRFYDKKKRQFFRCLVIFLAVAIYLTVVIPKIKTYPSTENDIVYITNSGVKYHTADCHHLRQSKIPTTIQEAIEDGYDSCSHCDPPLYFTKDIRIGLVDLYPRSSLATAALGFLILGVYFGLHFVLYWFIKHRKKQNK